MSNTCKTIYKHLSLLVRAGTARTTACLPRRAPAKRGTHLQAADLSSCVSTTGVVA